MTGCLSWRKPHAWDAVSNNYNNLIILSYMFSNSIIKDRVLTYLSEEKSRALTYLSEEKSRVYHISVKKKIEF